MGVGTGAAAAGELPVLEQAGNKQAVVSSQKLSLDKKRKAGIP